MTTLLLGDGAPDRTELIARTREWVEASPRLSAVRFDVAPATRCS